MDVEFWTGVLFAVSPVILVGLLFWFIMRSIFRADHSERSAYSRVEAEERAKAERDR